MRRADKNTRSEAIGRAASRRTVPTMNHVPVVTGAARGLGAHLVDALLERGTPKVYAYARDTTKVRQDPRVIAVAFDLQQPPTVPDDVTLLINNASTAEFAGPLEASPEAVAREMAINYEGTYATIRAFLPTLEANGGDARERALAAEPGQHAADDRLLGLQGRAALAHAGAAPGAADARRPRPRRLPGRDRHRDGRGYRGAQDRPARGRRRAAGRDRARRRGHLPRPQRAGDERGLVPRPEGVRARLRGGA